MSVTLSLWHVKRVLKVNNLPPPVTGARVKKSMIHFKGPSVFLLVYIRTLTEPRILAREMAVR